MMVGNELRKATSAIATGNDVISNTEVTTVYNEIDNAIETVGTNMADKLSDSIAPHYSSEYTYNIGDYVMFSNALYRCTTTISTEEDWTPSHWTKTSIIEILHNANII